MKIDDKLLDTITRQAEESPRLRMNFDLRNSAEDGSQRMLNALEPGTQLPIHRHRETSEVVVILRGAAVQYFYDDEGALTETITVRAGSDTAAMVIERGRWHRIESLEHGTVILECKDGAYKPISDEDILNK